MTELQSVSNVTKEIKVIQDAPIDPGVLEITAKKCDFKSNYLVSIFKNKNRIIRKLPKTQLTDLYLAEEIKKIARAYGGDPNLPASVQLECLKALHGEFAGISMAEVWLAFRLHASGLLEDLKRGEMYGGNMTAKSFCAVLGSWRKYKAVAVSTYIKELDAKKSAAEEEKRAEKMKANFWPRLVVSCKRLRENENTDWRDCPSYIFDAIRKTGMLDDLLKENWKVIWEDAQKLAVMEVAADNINEKARGKIQLVEKVAKEANNKAFNKSSQNIAKKISLFRLVILNENFNLELLTNKVNL